MVNSSPVEVEDDTMELILVLELKSEAVEQLRRVHKDDRDGNHCEDEQRYFLSDNDHIQFILSIVAVVYQECFFEPELFFSLSLI